MGGGEKKDWEQKEKKKSYSTNSNLTLSFAKPEKENLDDVYYAGQGL